mmetsp:Transcript_57739/g.114551  ORF Transcript_57739/g.114551 Transcript_57739/m.114551 type:complete len:122 (-) Transcript_57739:583-948(-)
MCNVRETPQLVHSSSGDSPGNNVSLLTMLLCVSPRLAPSRNTENGSKIANHRDLRGSTRMLTELFESDPTTMQAGLCKSVSAQRLHKPVKLVTKLVTVHSQSLSAKQRKDDDASVNTRTDF